jgi:hypothetical protein
LHTKLTNSPSAYQLQKESEHITALIKTVAGIYDATYEMLITVNSGGAEEKTPFQNENFQQYWLSWFSDFTKLKNA